HVAVRWADGERRRETCLVDDEERIAGDRVVRIDRDRADPSPIEAWPREIPEPVLRAQLRRVVAVLRREQAADDGATVEGGERRGLDRARPSPIARQGRQGTPRASDGRSRLA